jgi:integrase
VILLLSVKAGLRAKEIASLTWDMATTLDGEVGTAIHLTNDASKGRGGGRGIPLNRELRAALLDLRQMPSRGRQSPFVVTTEPVLPGPHPKRSSTYSLDGIETSASRGAPATAGDGPSSPTPPERSRRSAGRCVTSRRSLVTLHEHGRRRGARR